MLSTEFNFDVMGPIRVKLIEGGGGALKLAILV